MKKLLILLASVLVLSFSLLVTASAQTLTLTVDEVSAKPGESVQVPITVSGNGGSGLLGMVLQVACDPSLSLSTVTKGTALSGLTLTPPGDKSANPFNLVWDGQDADTSNGTVVILTFTVAENAPGTLPIVLSYQPGGIYDNDFNDLDPVLVNGFVAVDTAESYTAPVLSDKLSMRVSAPYGMRLRASVTPDQRGYAEEYGCLVACSADVGKEGLTFDTERLVCGAAFSKADGTDIQYAVSADGTVDFSAVLIGIPFIERKTELTVRTYIKISVGENLLTFYGNSKTLSLYDAALAFKNSDAYETAAPEQKELVDALCAD